MMDTAATIHWPQYKNSHSPLLGESWHVTNQGRQITNNLKQKIRFAGTVQSLKIYWEKHNKSQFLHTDPQCVAATLGELPPRRQRWVTKHSIGVCGVKAQMYRWRLSPSPICPRCEEIETSQHVWVCRGQDADKAWNDSINAVRLQLLELQTAPALLDHILQQLNHWRFGTTGQSDDNEAMSIATAHQEAIGWHGMLESRLAYTWTIPQQTHLQDLGSRRSARRWLIELGKKLIGVAWDLWAHRNGIEHKIHRNEKRQHIYDQTLLLLASNGPYDKKRHTLYQKLAGQGRDKLELLPQDYLVRWCRLMMGPDYGA
jgi:hypothetical protein